ncbi:MAG: RagB/SusD family nutrient uptake outer membrane protein [Marinilabiliaceae bacterium]|nr:RagB/SusD family nutrient uptake outer membrane protein [Marinilabiliaceae bacterium]
MKKFFLFLGISLITFCSCDDFLSHTPDQRMELRSPRDISELLVSAYSNCSYAILGELMSDNMIDNTSPKLDDGTYYNLGAYDRMHDEMFAWEHVLTTSFYDSVDRLWEQCYYAIAVCNHALEAIDRLLAEDSTLDLSSQKGEAYISRAYHHFILVNIFSMAYKDDSQVDMGIPYVTEPEKIVQVKYERSTVPDVYQKIEKDIEAGINLISDAHYLIPKYHFNTKAAHAFAARFFLFYRKWDKVIEHADIVLGNNPIFRDWRASLPTQESHGLWFINEKSPNNLLMFPCYSLLYRIFGDRYGCSRDAYSGSLGAQGGGPTGSLTQCFNGKLFYRGQQDYGSFFMGAGREFFEYSDKVAGIGYPHTVRVEFSNEETLLCRAEAKIYSEKYTLDDVLEDFSLYETSRNPRDIIVTENLLDSYFVTVTEISQDFPTLKNVYGERYKELNTEKMSPSWVVKDDILNYVRCVLLYRRVETIHNGMRFFDIKRYGIEITHHIGKDRVEHLTWNDPRRAVQIPADVIAAGLDKNPREPETKTITYKQDIQIK